MMRFQGKRDKDDSPSSKVTKHSTPTSSSTAKNACTVPPCQKQREKKCPKLSTLNVLEHSSGVSLETEYSPVTSILPALRGPCCGSKTRGTAASTGHDKVSFSNKTTDDSDGRSTGRAKMTARLEAIQSPEEMVHGSANNHEKCLSVPPAPPPSEAATPSSAQSITVHVNFNVTVNNNGTHSTSNVTNNGQDGKERPRIDSRNAKSAIADAQMKATSAAVNADTAKDLSEMFAQLGDLSIDVADTRADEAAETNEPDQPSLYDASFAWKVFPPPSSALTAVTVDPAAPSEPLIYTVNSAQIPDYTALYARLGVTMDETLAQSTAEAASTVDDDFADRSPSPVGSILLQDENQPQESSPDTAYSDSSDELYTGDNQDFTVLIVEALIEEHILWLLDIVANGLEVQFIDGWQHPTLDDEVTAHISPQQAVLVRVSRMELLFRIILRMWDYTPRQAYKVVDRLRYYFDPIAPCWTTSTFYDDVTLDQKGQIEQLVNVVLEEWDDSYPDNYYPVPDAEQAAIKALYERGKQNLVARSN